MGKRYEQAMTEGKSKSPVKLKNDVLLYYRLETCMAKQQWNNFYPSEGQRRKENPVILSISENVN